MRHFYVIANYAKPHTLFCVQEIKEYLTAKGAECVIAGPAASDNGRYHYTDTGRIPGDTQCVIVLGGDGTLIQAAHDLKGTSSLVCHQFSWQQLPSWAVMESLRSWT